MQAVMQVVHIHLLFAFYFSPYLIYVQLIATSEMVLGFFF